MTESLRQQLETTAIRASTVISWIAAILSVTVWLGWVALDARITKLENGGAPMDDVAKAKFDHFYSEHARIDRVLDRVVDRIDAMDRRVDTLEARAAAGKVREVVGPPKPHPIRTAEN